MIVPWLLLETCIVKHCSIQSLAVFLRSYSQSFKRFAYATRDIEFAAGHFWKINKNLFCSISIILPRDVLFMTGDKKIPVSFLADNIRHWHNEFVLNDQRFTLVGYYVITNNVSIYITAKYIKIWQNKFKKPDIQPKHSTVWQKNILFLP